MQTQYFLPLQFHIKSVKPVNHSFLKARKFGCTVNRHTSCSFVWFLLLSVCCSLNSGTCSAKLHLLIPRGSTGAITPFLFSSSVISVHIKPSVQLSFWNTFVIFPHSSQPFRNPSSSSPLVYEHDVLLPSHLPITLLSFSIHPANHSLPLSLPFTPLAPTLPMSSSPPSPFDTFPHLSLLLLLPLHLYPFHSSPFPLLFPFPLSLSQFFRCMIHGSSAVTETWIFYKNQI